MVAQQPAQKAKTKPVVLFIFFGLGLLHLAIGLINHYLFKSYPFDYGTYNFAFYDYAHLHISECTLYPSAGTGSFFQDHFSLTLFVFIPFYWLMAWLTGTYTLIILQWLVIMYGAWCSYKLIELKSRDYRLAALALVYYFILLGRFNEAVCDVNFAIIGAAMVPAFLYWFEKGHVPATILCFLLLVINREDFSLWLIFICGFLMAIHRREHFKLRFSGTLLAASLLIFVLMLLVIIPGIEDEKKQYTLFKFAVLGKTPGEALLFLFSHPVRALELLFVNHDSSNYYTGVKQEFYIVYLISGAFLLFYRPLFLLPFIPLLAKKMYSDDPIRWGIETYYSTEFVAILPVLIFWILISIKKEKLRLALATLICISTLYITLAKLTRPDAEHVANFSNSDKTDFLSRNFYKEKLDLAAVRDALRLIPGDAAVSASGTMLPHLALREKIYYFPRVDDADYLFVRRTNDNWPYTQEEYLAKLKEELDSGRFKMLIDHKDFMLLQRR